MIEMTFRNPFKCFILVMLMIGLPDFSMPWVFGADADPDSIGISVNAENESLTMVLEKISQASGYEIEFDQEWGDHPVNIKFQNESLEAALNRVLANLNHALIWNDSEKKISIFINGKVSARDSSSSPSRSDSSAVSRGSEVQRRPADRRSDRMPSRSQTEIRNTSPPAPARQSRGQVAQPDGDLPVSVSGEKTRFKQGTSTID